MALYFIKSAVCLLVLLLFHRLVLQREAMYHFNRFFLLFSVAVSFLIPLNTIEITVTQPLFEPEVATGLIPEVESLQIQPAVSQSEKSLDWKLVLILFYGLITFSLMVRFVRNINILFEKVNRNVLIQYRGENLVMLEEDCPPFSFLKYIFVSYTDFEAGKFTDAILIHESTHVKEKHSWDNLLIEFLLVFFWFHPGLYWVKTAIKLNHEFISAQAALKIIPVENYKLQLLSMVLTGQNFGLASSLNFSLTKKRLEMMKQKTTNSMKWIKILALLPVLGALVYFVSERVIAQNNEGMPRTTNFLDLGEDASDSVDIHLNLIQSGTVSVDNKTYRLAQTSEILKEVPKKENGLVARVSVNQGISTGDVFDLQMALFDNGVTHVELVKAEKKTIVPDSVPSTKKDLYYQHTTFYIQDKNGDKTQKFYSDLSKSEKARLPEPPPAPKKANPTSKTFEGWKDSKMFALWLDGIHVPNSKLDEMDASQIVHVFSSKIYRNALSERFPQDYQVYLYTDEGFDKAFGPDSDLPIKPLGGYTILYTYD